MDNLTFGLAVNHAIRFVLEVISIVAIGYWGFKLEKGVVLQYIMGIGAPLLIIVVWAMFGSPGAPYRLQGMFRLGLELTIYSLAFGAIIARKSLGWAIIFGVVVVINTLFLYIFPSNDH
ncbi:YrdB family protein [Evansella sp. AB-rgal1]|uniref:YrdB family protein n=1 Tax=Evansella sp. AB-rgal1 TaxID=3242696 RepID=UPI00359DAB82